jgi:hypothetical protein
MSTSPNKTKNSNQAENRSELSCSYNMSNETNATNLNKDTNMAAISTPDDSATRFALIELGDAVHAPAPALAVVAVPRRVEGGVCAEGKARAQADEADAVAAGWSLKPPVYDIGSRVNSTGVDNFRASRQEHDDKASVGDACGKLIDLVKAEDRRDLVVPVPSLKMLDDGRITRGGGPLAVSERAITGVATHITPGGAGYLRACEPDLRAINFNRWAAKGYREDSRATADAIEAWEEGGNVGPQPGPVMAAKHVTLRTRLNHASNKREAWSFVGPKYGAHDVDAIAEQVMRSEAIPADAKCDITYDGYRMRMNVLFHTDIQPEKAVAGEIFKAGIMLKTADDGSGSIQVSAQVFRNLCLNLIIIDHAKELVTRRKHFGTGIADAVANGIATAMGKVQVFADKWSEATLENVLEKYGAHDVEAVMRGLVYNKVVHVGGVKPDEMFERLMRAYQAEPGYGKTAIVNAVTRAAHSETWGSWADVEDLERKGGELLFAKAWNVAIPEGEREGLSY